MKTIQQSATYALDVELKHDAKYDIHTLEFWQTWPTMAKPYARRVAQFNLPAESIEKLVEVLSGDEESAQLRAAAPALLEALERVVSEAEEMIGDIRFDFAHEAIALARGDR